MNSADRLNEIKELKEKIAELEKEEQAFQALTPVERLAIKIHDMMCHHNHTDACGWFYEIRQEKHDWTGGSHEPYMRRAKKVIKICKDNRIEPEVATNILQVLRDY